MVVVDEPRGWVAFFCTDPSAGVADILGRVADRFSLETAFRDVKDLVGAGHQQVRRVRASVAAFHLCVWRFTLTEAWAWEKRQGFVVDHRKACPWDDSTRRPSHADKRRAWQRELLAKELQAVRRRDLTADEIPDAAQRILDLAA